VSSSAANLSDDWIADRIGGLKLILRCGANPNIGLGHVKRCLALAGWLKEKPVFALAEATDAVHDQIRVAGYKTIALSGTPEARADALRNVQADAIVLDIAHMQSRLARDVMRKEIGSLKSMNLPIVFIDGIDTDALADAELASQLSLCVRPYPGVKAETGGRWLVGAEYFIVSPGLARGATKPRLNDEHATRVLVTTGGGDVGALGPRIIGELSAGPEPRFDIRVIVGPLVSSDTRRATREAATASPHRVEIYEDRNDLMTDMRWSDMAVATTGLTKYELALNAVPSILISPDEHHEMNHRSFRERNTALNLGVAGLLSSGAIREACLRLATDGALRRRLSEESRKLIDGKGALRLLSEIKSLADAR
jgi:spore coat polysaccharide biosynthesis predicted glycosyltransferase SpsG